MRNKIPKNTNSTTTPVFGRNRAVTRFFCIFCCCGKKGQTLSVCLYSHIPIDKKSAIVYAEVVTGKLNNNDYRIINSYTFVYQMIRGETKIIYEHTSYEYFCEKEPLESKTLSMDMYTFQFVKHLLLENTRQERLCITNGSQTLYLDINTLLYIQGDRHNTLLYCIDKQITCSKTLQELKEELSDDFY